MHTPVLIKLTEDKANSTGERVLVSADDDFYCEQIMDIYARKYTMDFKIRDLVSIVTVEVFGERFGPEKEEDLEIFLQARDFDDLYIESEEEMETV